VLKREIAKSFSKHRTYGSTIPSILKYLIMAQTNNKNIITFARHFHNL
jgi:hypothetical protein